MTYTFFIKNEKTKSYRLVSQLLVFFNLLGLIFLLITNEITGSNKVSIIFGLALTGVYTLFTVAEWITKKALPDFWHRSVFAFCAFIWIKNGVWFPGIILLAFTGLDIIAQRKLVVEINEKKIVLPSFPVKKAAWSEMNNVILKDGLLTIDFKNNNLFQQVILNSDFDEKEFNRFCQRQLNK